MEYFNSLWKFLIISSPFLLIGLFAAGLIHAFVSTDQIKKLMGGKSIGSVIRASLLGIPLPLCSCSVIPMAITLKKSGANNGATSSFLISTPESGVDSVMVTYALMDLPMTIIRPIAAFITAFIAGWMQLLFNPETQIIEDNKPTSCCSSKKKEAPVEEEKSSYLSKQKPKAFNKIKDAFEYAFINLIDDMAFWLMIGIVVGAAIDFFVPPELFSTLNGGMGRFVILLIGIPLYICASASTPIAASLVMKGLSPGSALLFLLVGPATNISNIVILQKYIGKKGVIINIAVIALVSLGLSYLVDYIYAALNISINFKLGSHEHSNGSAWWEIASAVMLSLLVIKGIIKKKFLSK